MKKIVLAAVMVASMFVQVVDNKGVIFTSKEAEAKRILRISHKGKNIVKVSTNQPITRATQTAVCAYGVWSSDLQKCVNAIVQNPPKP